MRLANRVCLNPLFQEFLREREKVVNFVTIIKNVSLKVLTGVVICGMCPVFCGDVQADRTQQEQEAARPDSDFSITIGGFGLYKPEYEGSDDYEFTGFPLLDLSWRNRIFLNARRGGGFYLWNTPDTKAGLSIGYAFGRDEDDSDDLRGLGDIDGGATGNAFFQWKAGDLSLETHYAHQFTGDTTGFQVHMGVGYGLRITRAFIVRTGVKTTFANSQYMEAYFGISPEQSNLSGLPVYDADASFKSAGLNITAIYRLSRNLGFQTFAGYSRLIGNAADSPVVKNENQFRVGLGLSCSFF